MPTGLAPSELFGMRLWVAEMRSVMKHAYKCGAIRRVLVLRRRFVAFPEARLQLALKRKALAGQWNDADDDGYIAGDSSTES